jgi:hypothetical protein
MRWLFAESSPREFARGHCSTLTYDAAQRVPQDRTSIPATEQPLRNLASDFRKTATETSGQELIQLAFYTLLAC